MSRLARFSRQAFDLKTLHHRRARALPFLSSFSTSATESAAASEPKKPLYTPPPVGVAPTKNVGRAAFALQNLAAGEVLHSAKPVVAHPYLSMMNCVCYYCLRRLPKRDSGAEPSPTVSFCSELCEQSSKKFYDVEKQVDWSSFHEYCRQRGLKYPLMVKRFACQIIARKIPTAMFDLLHGESLTPEKISLIKEEFSLLYSILDGADIKVEKDESKGSATKGEEENEELLSCILMK